MKKSFFKSICLLIAASLFALPANVFAQSLERKQKLDNLLPNTNFSDKYVEPEVGTVPLPPEKEMNYPYPDGNAKLKVNYPNEVNVGEEFNISITYETTSDPFSALLLFPYLYIPAGTNLPTEWRQQNVSPWAPEDNTDVSGTIETLPSLDWVSQNYYSWYGVGIAPFNGSSVLLHSSQGWNHGHYFFAFDGDYVTLTYGPISYDEAGTYQFEVNPIGAYTSGGHFGDYSTPVSEPVSFDINVTANAVEATVDIKPETLNLKSRGENITAYIEVPEELDPANIVINTLRLEDTIPALDKPKAIGDYDGDGLADLMVKFDRNQVIEKIKSKGNGNLKLSGTIIGASPLVGEDTIKIK